MHFSVASCSFGGLAKSESPSNQVQVGAEPNRTKARAQSQVVRPSVRGKCMKARRSPRPVRWHRSSCVSVAPRLRARQQGQTVVGASRRRAAPGSQPVESFATPPVRGYAIGTRFGVCWRPAEQPRAVSFVNKCQRPNPSIEGTSNIRLRRRSAAPHVKR